MVWVYALLIKYLMYLMMSETETIMNFDTNDCFEIVLISVSIF